MSIVTPDGAAVASPRKPAHPHQAHAQRAREVITEQAMAIANLATRVDGAFGRAVELLLSRSGHAVTCGMGKSGLIAKKIAATLASTGTPSFFMHPGEAYHGDLGMVTAEDCVILLSYSGETSEVTRLLPHLKDFGVPTISIVGVPNSTLGRNADVTLDASVPREVCPHNLAPTNSTLAALALGDALAVALMRERGFEPEDFARFHPGGSLGRRLYCRVRDAMREGALPRLDVQDPMSEALVRLARARSGLALVYARDALVGVVSSEGLADLCAEQLHMPVASHLEALPPKVTVDTRIGEAERVLAESPAKALLVVDAADSVVGVFEGAR